MGRLLCLFGWHRRSHRKLAYNVRTGALRYFYECVRCHTDMKVDV